MDQEYEAEMRRIQTRKFEKNSETFAIAKKVDKTKMLSKLLKQVGFQPEVSTLNYNGEWKDAKEAHKNHLSSVMRKRKYTGDPELKQDIKDMVEEIANTQNKYVTHMQEIETAINKTNPTGAPGYDGISQVYLATCTQTTENYYKY